MLAYHPSQNDLLLAKYKRMGEIAFCADQGRLAKQWIAENPGKFVVISCAACVFFWNGITAAVENRWLAETKNIALPVLVGVGIWGLLLALKRRVHGVFLFASLIVVLSAGLLYLFSASRDTGIRSILNWSSLECTWFPKPNLA